LERTKTFPSVFTRSFTFNPTKRGFGKGDVKGETISGPVGGGFVPGIEERSDSPAQIGNEEEQVSTAASSGVHLGRNGEVGILPGGASNGYARVEGGLDMSRIRTIQLNESYRNRQKLRAVSLHPESPQDVTFGSSQDTARPVVTNIPRPFESKHSGFGGFPTPLQILPSIFPSSAKSTMRQRLARTETHATLLTNPRRSTLAVDGLNEEESWGDLLKAQVAKWMPENLGGLVIGRNSRFYTEELGDEELEVLGGVEYRALRLLGYLVGAVSFSRKLADSPVHHPLPAYPIRYHCHLLLSNRKLGRILSSFPRRPIWNSE
jgi:hypothetical protein